jgi:hypothetical protein
MVAAGSTMLWTNTTLHASLVRQLEETQISLLSQPASEASEQSAAERRADRIESAREEKETRLRPETEPKLQHEIKRVQHNFVYRLMSSDFSGFGVELGSLGPASGFALGPTFSKKNLVNGQLDLKVRGRVAVTRSYLGRVDASFHNLIGDRFTLDLSADHRSLSEIPYYGPGPDSEKSERTNYRLEDTTVEARPSFTPFRHFRVGAIGAHTKMNVSPGHSRLYISTERVFTPEQIPGIDQQTTYWRGGGFLQFDGRDRDWAPTSGGKYTAQYSRYVDRDVDRYSFLRLDFDASHYIPLFNHTRVIALHGSTSLTKTNGTQVVPFYMQPTLGGAESLRGYRSYRFYGNNSVLGDVEYRWEVSPTFSVAAFADGGKVFDRWSQWNLHHAESDVGFGFAVRTETKVVFRIDTGFSHEGVQVWFRANNIF